MTRPYKRIFQVSPARVSNLLSIQRSGITIRQARTGEDDEWVAEGPFSQRGLIDQIACTFDQQAA